MSKFRRFAFVAVLALASAFALKYAIAAPVGDPNALVGKPAPDFDLKTLDGKQVKLSDFKGNVVVVDFWATWCPPCRKSLPHLQTVHANKELADKGLKVLAVDAQEKNDTIQKFIDENKYTFTVPIDADGSILKNYGVRGIPTTVIVGRDGNVRNVFVGFGDGSEKPMDDAIQAAVAEKAKK